MMKHRLLSSLNYKNVGLFSVCPSSYCGFSSSINSSSSSDKPVFILERSLRVTLIYMTSRQKKTEKENNSEK